MFVSRRNVQLVAVIRMLIGLIDTFVNRTRWKVREMKYDATRQTTRALWRCYRQTGGD